MPFGKSGGAFVWTWRAEAAFAAAMSTRDFCVLASEESCNCRVLDDLRIDCQCSTTTWAAYFLLGRCMRLLCAAWWEEKQRWSSRRLIRRADPTSRLDSWYRAKKRYPFC